MPKFTNSPIYHGFGSCLIIGAWGCYHWTKYPNYFNAFLHFCIMSWNFGHMLSPILPLFQTINAEVYFSS